MTRAEVCAWAQTRLRWVLYCMCLAAAGYGLPALPALNANAINQHARALTACRYGMRSNPLERAAAAAGQAGVGGGSRTQALVGT